MSADRKRRLPAAAPWLIAGLVGAIATGWYLRQGDPDLGAREAAALIDRYCVDCHNGVEFAGSLRLDDTDIAAIGHDAEIWERVVRKLGSGMMPPAGEPRPERARIDALVAELTTRLDEVATPTPGPATIRRLNRAEYANAIRDLLALDIDAATLLPLDDSSEGFDNIAAALGTSPALAEAYISAAMKISRWAIGDRTAPRTQISYAAPAGLNQHRHLDGLPLGTRGGFSFEHLFPLDGEYDVVIRRDFRAGGSVDLTIDGAVVALDESARAGRARVTVAAGPREVTVALVDTLRSAGVDNVYSEPPAPNGVTSVEIDGPLAATGVGDTPSRRRILSCTPAANATAAEAGACAEQIVTALATRAFRRPLEADELPPLMAFYENARAAGSAESASATGTPANAGTNGAFEQGIQHALARILVDPRFLYRIEADRPSAGDGLPYPVSDYELATRLSFFLWSSLPDEALLERAASGRLHEPDVLAGEVTRMLGDPKAGALIENFAAQWLFLRELESVTPDAGAFDANLRLAMREETELLLETIMREDLSILRLLDAEFTFVNERLAEHYGYDGVHGSHFRRIEIPGGSPRRGLLGHASILTLTSVTNRTSPVIRGSWILETLLGSPAPIPPPDVETTLEGDDGAAVAQTVRERLEAHRANPTCAACHAIMDPYGLTLENFDLIGAWRDTDAGQPIDTRVVLVDGSEIDGPDALRQALMDRSDAFVTSTAEKLLTYALGRRLEHYDMPTIRAIVGQAASEDYRFASLVRGIVASEPFRLRVNGGSE